jgi:glycosyltransferase involved in cell wall biosynthesis
MSKVSVVIATHNRSALLRSAVASARAAGSDLEIIVVDDASTDDTPEVCATMEGIRFIRLERNQGIVGVRNIGVMAAASELVTFLDDDDLRLPGSLDVQVEALERRKDAGLVFGQALLADQEGFLTGRLTPRHCPEGDVFWELLAKNFIPCASAVFRRSCLLTIGPPTTVPTIPEDWDLWIRIAEMYPVIAVQQPVVIYRVATAASKQFTSDAAGVVRKTTNAHRTRWMNLPRARSAEPRQRRLARRRFSFWMAKHLLKEGAIAVLRGHVGAAFRSLVTLVRLHPAGALACLGNPSLWQEAVRWLPTGATRRKRAGRRNAVALLEEPAGSIATNTARGPAVR